MIPYGAKITQLFDPLVFDEDALVILISACTDVKNAAALDQHYLPRLSLGNQGGTNQEEERNVRLLIHFPPSLFGYRTGPALSRSSKPLFCRGFALESLLVGPGSLGARTVHRNRPAKLVSSQVRAFSCIVIVHVGQ